MSGVGRFQCGLLKVAPPEAWKPFLPQIYADTVMGILRSRCAVLRKLGLKAAFTISERCERRDARSAADYKLASVSRLRHRYQLATEQ